MPKRIVAGNWKMNGSAAFLADFVRAFAAVDHAGGVDVLLFPPTVLLSECVRAVADLDIGVGSQTVHPEASGAFTGECSAEQVADVGARWTLVGHSERRQYAGEDDAAVVARVHAAARAGLASIVCVGETLEERRAGRAEAVVCAQLDAVLASAPAGLAAVAYEPVWAIGTGETATPAQAQAMHSVLRAQLVDSGRGECPLLYGGSVKADNAAALFAEQDIDGGLVGGASLDAKAFAAIVAAAG